MLKAGGFSVKVLLVLACTDQHSFRIARKGFVKILKQASPEEREKLMAIWQRAGLPEMPLENMI